MKLRSWQQRWMWMAIGAAASTTAAEARDPAPTRPAKPSDATPAKPGATLAKPVDTAPAKPAHAETASLWDAPLLANAKYVAHAGAAINGDFVSYEHGPLSCKEAEQLWSFAEPSAEDLAKANKTCQGDLGKQLHAAVNDQQDALFVVDAKGAVLSTRAAILAAAKPIDTAAKALLAVWASPYHFLAPGTYEPEWVDKEQGVQSGVAPVRAVKDGFEVTALRVARGDCRNTAKEGPMRAVKRWRVVLHVDASGALKEKSSKKVPAESEFCGGMGRRPEGFVDEGGEIAAVEEYLRRALHLEAESVRAFERIARELTAHGAPDELIEGALLAAAQERGHAARCAALLGVDAEIASDELPIRALFELALDNAREGCVVESFGALTNAVQARDAATPELRAHFAALAADELDHAALAHAIASWLDSGLSPTELVAVRAAKLETREQLDQALAAAPADDALARELGIPRGARARRLLELVPA